MNEFVQAFVTAMALIGSIDSEMLTVNQRLWARPRSLTGAESVLGTVRQGKKRPGDQSVVIGIGSRCKSVIS